ncbi:MAG: AAA family ATPase [Desulfobulbaceae bacterium]
MMAVQNYGDTAIGLFHNGYLPLPVKGKRPAVTGWSSGEITNEKVKLWSESFSGMNVGVRADSAQAIDIDVYDESIVDELIKYLKKILNYPVLAREGKAPKVLVPVNAEISRKMVSRKFKDRKGNTNCIELLTTGQQWVAFGMHPDTNKEYVWRGKSPLDISLDELPCLDESALLNFFAFFAQLAEQQGWEENGTLPAEQTPIQNIPPPSDYYTPWGRYSATVDPEDIVELFEGAGWEVVGPGKTTEGDAKIDLRRPGKTDGISGSIIKNDEVLLFHCFTTSSNHFQGDRTYTAFEVRKILEFDGDNSSCIRALVKEGFKDPLYGKNVPDSIRGRLIEAEKADDNLINSLKQTGVTLKDAEAVLDWYELPGEELEKLWKNKKLRVSTLADFIDRDIPETKYALYPIIPESGAVEIFAYRGVGKTHVAIGIAVAAASGGSFLKWKAPEPCGVLYVDGEMSTKDLQDRMIATLNQCDGDIKAGGKNMRLLSAVDQDIDVSIPCIGTKEGQMAIEEQITPDTKLIIFDNLSSLLRSTGTANDEEHWKPMVDWIVDMRKKGISLLIIHHANKSGDARGSSFREDLLNVVIKLERPSDYNEEEGARLVVRLVKARGIYNADARPFEAHLKDGVWEMRNLNQSTYEKVRDLANEGYKQNDIAEKLGINKSTVSKHIKNGKENKEILTPEKKDSGQD